jgi:hypothetical protein
MPIEYYLAAAVALIVLVLLVFALTGKKTKRVVVQKNPSSDELTRQVARAAAALEALLLHLKASPQQVITPLPQQAAPRVAPAPKVEQVAARTVVVAPEDAKPEPPLAPSIPQPIATGPVVVEPTPVEPVATEEELHAAQKPRRVKLSMFGR